MKKANHTLISWKIERPSRKRGGNFDEKQAITAGSYGTICVCTRADARTDTDSPYVRLIAEAPEMLKALKHCVEIMQDFPLSGLGLAVLENAKTVITRATA